MPDKDIGLCRVTAVLLYNLVLQFITNGFNAVVIPIELSIWKPSQTALYSGLMTGIGSTIMATSPIVGHYADAFGRRPVIVLGAFIVSCGEALLIMGVYTRNTSSDFGFTLYSSGYLVTQIGTVLMSTCFNAMVADLSSEYPHKAGKISAIYGLYGLTGAMLSYVAAGFIFPVSKSNHLFYWFAAAVTTVANIALLLSVPPSPPKDKSDQASESGLRRCGVVCSLWMCSDDYLPWRRVVASRALYFFGGGVFGALILFFFYDCTDSADPVSTMGITAVVSLTGSLVAAYPAGMLADRFGSVICVFLAGILMAIVFTAVPLLDNTSMILFFIPFYGMAQQVYNVADLSMITAALPDPEKRARDMGGWVAVDSIGGALGSVLAGVIITLVGKSDRTVAEDHDDKFFVDTDDDEVASRIAYTRHGYAMVFWPAAGAVLLGSLILWPIRHRLEHKKDSQDDEDKKTTPLITDTDFY
jgi:MFS family permease